MTNVAQSMTRRDALLTLASVLAACNRTRGGRPRVAFVLKTFNSPFFLDMRHGAEAAATPAGIDLVVQAAEREVDVERQMQIIENLIETRVAVLCICPSGSKEIVPAVGKANRAGIPVIIVDDQIDEGAAAEQGVKFDTYIGSDKVGGGRLARQNPGGPNPGTARPPLPASPPRPHTR